MSNILKSIISRITGRRKARPQRSEPMTIHELIDANLRAGYLAYTWEVA